MNEVYINFSLFRFKDFPLSAKADRLLEGSEAGSAGRFPLTFSETSAQALIQICQSQVSHHLRY